MMPLISIILPVYNVEVYLRQCLDSIFAQTYQNIEVVIVDDGSTDASYAICQAYADVRLFRQANAGVSAARNKALQEAKGEWVFFADPDDWLESNTIQDLYESAVHNHVKMSISGYTTVYEDSSRENVRQGLSLIPQRQILEGIIDISLSGTLWNKLFHKDILQGVTFDENAKRGGDGLFCIMATMNCEQAVYVPKSLYNYRERAGSIMTVFSENSLKALYSQQRVIDIVPANIKTMAKSRYVVRATMLILSAYQSGKAHYVKELRNDAHKYLCTVLYTRKLELKYRIISLLTICYPKLSYAICKRYL